MVGPFPKQFSVLFKCAKAWDIELPMTVWKNICKRLAYKVVEGDEWFIRNDLHLHYNILACISW